MEAFTTVDDESDQAATQQTAQVIDHPAKESVLATQMMMLALKALSQRALVAVSTLFTAAGLFGGWWLWNGILADPSPMQLVGVTLYAVFFIGLEIVRRR